MKQIYTTTLRLNLENEADRRAWEHLQSLDRREYRSVSKAVVSAVNAYFDRSKQLADDPYLETRERRTLSSAGSRIPSHAACRAVRR